MQTFVSAVFVSMLFYTVNFQFDSQIFHIYIVGIGLMLSNGVLNKKTL